MRVSVSYVMNPNEFIINDLRRRTRVGKKDFSVEELLRRKEKNERNTEVSHFQELIPLSLS